MGVAFVAHKDPNVVNALWRMCVLPVHCSAIDDKTSIAFPNSHLNVLRDLDGAKIGILKFYVW